VRVGLAVAVSCATGVAVAVATMVGVTTAGLADGVPVAVGAMGVEVACGVAVRVAVAGSDVGLAVVVRLAVGDAGRAVTVPTLVAVATTVGVAVGLGEDIGVDVAGVDGVGVADAEDAVGCGALPQVDKSAPVAARNASVKSVHARASAPRGNSTVPVPQAVAAIDRRPRQSARPSSVSVPARGSDEAHDSAIFS
jgi:hypothetical protein